jgi:hypothetical protein
MTKDLRTDASENKRLDFRMLIIADGWKEVSKGWLREMA